MDGDDKLKPGSSGSRLPARGMLTIVMPALNEEDNVRAAVTNALKAFDDLKIGGEVIVVNDGSTDGTEKIVREMMAAESRVRIVCHEKPRGIGASFWDGVDHARGEFVCMLPGDNENDPWEIFRYYPLLLHVDLVIPFVFNKQVRSLFRNTLSFMYRFIINTTFLVYFNYTNGTVMYRRSLLKELDFRSTGFFFQTDILVRTVKRGYLFAEVPYRLNVRTEGVSKAVSFPSLLQVMRGYIRLVRDYYFNKEVKPPAAYAEGSVTASRYADVPAAKRATQAES
ncbi:MAG: glycosyltransferase family 2 protein [Planctomycetota bacterium]|nr:glycosyltransferase family 2 protein [Planctomycetota bacterium]